MGMQQDLLKVKKGDTGFGLVVEDQWKKLVIKELLPIKGTDDNIISEDTDVDNDWDLSYSTS